MRFSRLLVLFVFTLSLAGLSYAVEPVAGSSAPPILPKQFAGWQIQGAAQASKDVNAADPTNTALLKEYGFTDFESATYKSDDGRTLKIRAARFADASGAFGAYSFYLQPEMAREEIGDQGASLNQRVLLYRGHILVDAVFSQLSVMSAARLRELAGVLPRPSGNAGNLPPILAFMPHHGYEANTEKYAEGPLALGAIESPLPASLVDFSSNPEVVLGQYSTPSGAATLMLIEYPTPGLAAEHLRRIDAAHPEAGVASVENLGPFFDKRTGPIVAIAAGNLSQTDAQILLGAVNWDASVTWNENTYFDKKNNIANLLVNIIILCIIVGALSLAAGLAFGGARVLLRRFFPGPIFGHADQTEFISLDLRETSTKSSASASSSRADRPKSS